MLKVVDITQIVPKALENGKTVKGPKNHGKTAIDGQRQCYILRPSPSVNRVMQVRDHQFIRIDFFLRRIPFMNVA